MIIVRILLLVVCLLQSVVLFIMSRSHRRLLKQLQDVRRMLSDTRLRLAEAKLDLWSARLQRDTAEAELMNRIRGES